MAKEIAYLLKKKEERAISLHQVRFLTFVRNDRERRNAEKGGMTNNAVISTNIVISTEGRNLFRQESLGYSDYRNFEAVVEKPSWLVSIACIVLRNILLMSAKCSRSEKVGSGRSRWSISSATTR